MQLPEAEGLVSKTRAKAVVLLNAQWTDTKSVPSRHGSFVGSFETVYCFQPIAIQVRALVLRCSWQKPFPEHGQQFSLNSLTLLLLPTCYNDSNYLSDFP